MFSILGSRMDSISSSRWEWIVIGMVCGGGGLLVGVGFFMVWF